MRRGDCVPLPLNVIVLLFWFSCSCDGYPRASFVLLIRSSLQDVELAFRALSQMEANFNNAVKYPYSIFVEENFPDEWKDRLRSTTQATMNFVQLMFELPPFVTRARVPQYIEAYERNFTVGYRHMCRFFGGAMVWQKALAEYDYLWRIDADAEYLCPITYDPFQYMHTYAIKYGWVMEYFEADPEVVGDLFTVTKQFMADNSIPLSKLSRFINIYGDYNRCHYWNNFEIVDANFLRGPQYQKYFDYIDRAGGIFYERWGDALIRTLGAHMFLEPEEIRQLSGISYRHANTCNHMCRPDFECEVTYQDGISSKCSFPTRYFHGSTEEVSFQFFLRLFMLVAMLLCTGTVCFRTFFPHYSHPPTRAAYLDANRRPSSPEPDDKSN
eukprot:TRINITY_DN3357_c0_g1_i1.p1 TRINITY_DN3357_c0_g1~~TRINITY_DN3357_c0_g1_i1.p1  ORF type:complete len:384 (+),score=100.40 TRINITY_DN3357_c0_g1_i1:120-1271(+)